MTTEEPMSLGEIFDRMTRAAMNGDERTDWVPERVGQLREPLSDDIRDGVLLRDGFTCQWCLASKRDGTFLHIDHIVPWSAGGADHPVNLRVLCQRCNEDRSNRVTDMGIARALPIALWCVRCTPVPDRLTTDASLDELVARSVLAYCLHCRSHETSSPFRLLGGPIPATGVPA